MIDKPWIQCPSCWIPIDVRLGRQVNQHFCKNTNCALSHLQLSVKVFPDKQKALSSYQQENNACLIGGVSRFSDIFDHPISFWGYFRCDEQIDRFRLLDGQPLIKLVSKDLIADWEHGVALRNKRAFTIFSVEYDRLCGKVKSDNSGYPILAAARPLAEGSLGPVPVGYCDVCNLIRTKCTEHGNDPTLIDPCMKCNRRIVSVLFENGRIDHRELRLAVLNPSRPSPQLFDALHHHCWLGLVDMAFPIMVADVIVAIVFTGQIRPRGLRKCMKSSVLSDN